MSHKEPNDYSEQEWADLHAPDERPDPDDAYDQMLEFEAAERAAEELRESGKFGEVQIDFGKSSIFEVTLSKDLPVYPEMLSDCASVVKQAALQAHEDFLVTHGLKK